MPGSWDPTAQAWWVIMGFSCRNHIIDTRLGDMLGPIGGASWIT